jgi:hypothetical protein
VTIREAIKAFRALAEGGHEHAFRMRAAADALEFRILSVDVSKPGGVEEARRVADTPIAQVILDAYPILVQNDEA